LLTSTLRKHIINVFQNLTKILGGERVDFHRS